MILPERDERHIQLTLRPVTPWLVASAVALRSQAVMLGVRGYPASMSIQRKPGFAKAYSFGIVTALLFLLSWAGQFTFQLMEVRNQAEQHGQPFSWSDFWPQFLSSTFENWQSEFLQLVWQAAGLSFLLFWGSSQSKESDARLEAKVDALLRARGIDPGSVDEDVDEHLDVDPKGA